ncbi:MAG: hypothetical protein F6K51_21000 [Moorea sp. SIO3I8]|nr:hypothetical protein [Moorena sp. SIO3I8]
MVIPGESFPNINNALVALGEALRSEFQALIGEYTAGGLAGNYLTSEDCSELRCLEEVVSQVGQLGEEFTALETWLTSGFIPKGLATPFDADSGYDCATPRACFQSFPQDYDPPQPPLIRGEPYSKSPERGIARSGDNGGFSKTRPSPMHTSIEQHPTPNPTMEDSWSTPVGGDQVSQGNNSEVFVTSGDVQLSRVESGATRRQKVEGRGQKLPTITPVQELTLDEKLSPSSSVVPSTQPRSKKPTLERNEAVLPKHSSNVQGLKELAELLASQEQLDLAKPNLVSASDPTLHSNLVDPEDLEDNGNQLLFTHATPDQLIDDYGSGEEISGASPESLQRFPSGADIDVTPPQAFQTSSDPSAISHQPMRYAHAARTAISHQPMRYAHAARTAISHQPMRYAHAARTAISLCATRTLREQPSAITHYPLPITHQPLPITHQPLPITHSSDPSKLETEVETEMISRNGTPEMDLDEIMDAIARKVSREYRRFYGSS